MCVVDKGADLLIITARGMGKRSNIGTGIADQDRKTGGYRMTKRGGKGVTGIKLKEGDEVAAALLVELGGEIMMTTVSGQMVRINTDEVRTIGRTSQGVKVIDLRGKDMVTGVSIIRELELQEGDEDGEGEDESEGEGEAQAAPEATADSAESAEPEAESEKEGE
jgi:DNA gyrase subunit A